MGFIGFLVVWITIGFVGYLIGKFRSRAVEGFVWGLLLGPIGWVVVAIRPDYCPKGSACKGNIVQSATKCKNCGSDL